MVETLTDDDWLPIQCLLMIIAAVVVFIWWIGFRLWNLVVQLAGAVGELFRALGD